MPFYLRIKTEKGHKMVETVPPHAIEEISLEQPSLPTMPGGKAAWTCSLCEKSLPTAGVSAMHFAKSHQDLDKTRWREYIKQHGAPR